MRALSFIEKRAALLLFGPQGQERMGRFIIVRLLQTVVALVGISLLVFILVRASGDPTMLMRTATSHRGRHNEYQEAVGPR